MKKILLLAALSCFLIVQTKIVSGKCSASLTITRASDNAEWEWHNGTYPSTSLISLAPGDSVTCTYSCNGVCFSYNPAWYYRDDLGQYVLIKYDAGNISTINISVDGIYRVCPISNGCGCYIYSFQISTVPSGIPNLSTSTLPFPFSKLSSGINLNNLNYKIIIPLGQIIEQGKFSGEIILRGKNISNSLPPGIYFVVYSDALDNRQVITDKVFVSNR